MLKQIRLKNFKLHEDTTIDASRITVFIGPNNSGKSSIFQALLALKQAARKTNSGSLLGLYWRGETNADQPYLYSQLDGPIVDLGDYEDVVRDASKDLQIGADMKVRPEGAAASLVKQTGKLSLGYDVFFSEDQLSHHKGYVSCGSEEIRWEWHRGRPQGARYGAITIPGEGRLFVTPGEGLRAMIQFGIERSGTVHPEVSRQDNDLLRSLGQLWGCALDSLSVVPQLRGFEEWGHPSTGAPRHERLDRLVLADRAVALTNLLAANAKLRTQISDMLRSLVGVGIEFETAAAHRVKVYATSAKTGAPETLFVNEGSGANQLPFILVPVALAQSGDSVVLSEPEAHLHPKRQSDLIGMALKIFAFAAGELQFFIETHSEHVLHRLLHAVAKGELAREDLTIYYFENKDGRAEARKLKIDEQGGVEGGLPGFFDQSLDELTEYLEALKQPKK